MIERFALEYDNKDLNDDVCLWLNVNGIDPCTVPIYSEVRVSDGQISYDEMQLTEDGKRTGESTRRQVPVVVPMAPELADRWRLPSRLCDRCHAEMGTQP